MKRTRLDSWKEIANFLGCSEKTARRKELQYGLPVHRMPGGSHSAVFAYVDELERWLASGEATPDAVAGRSGRRKSARVLAVSFAGACLVLILLSMTSGQDIRLIGGPLRLTLSTDPILPPLLASSDVVYFQVRAPGSSSYQIVRVQQDGAGSTETLETTIENPEPLAISPDEGAMLIRSVTGPRMDDGPVFVQPLPSGQARRLGDVLALDAAWTPDGRRIVFSQRRSVHTISSEGTGNRKAFDVPGRAFGFRWSPDGRLLRFTVLDPRTSSYRLWQSSDQFEEPKLVPLDPESSPQQCCGSWSPDGRLYFYQALVDGAFQIFVKPDGRSFWGLGPAGKTGQITNGPLQFRSPVPAADGKRLLMLAHSQKSEVVYLEPSSRRWLPLLEGVAAATASFSPDGNWLAFTRLPGHTLWTCRMPGCREQTQLTFGDHIVTMLKWSPDGTQIAVMFRSHGAHYQIGVIPAQGGPLVNMLHPNEEGADPDWSPDGRQIYFGVVPGSGNGTNAPLRVVDLATRRINRVAGSEGMHTPRLSPNGRYLAAVTSSQLGLAILDKDSGKWTRTSGVRVGYLNWSESSDKLFVLARSSQGPPRIVAVDPAQGKLEAIADMSRLRHPSFALGDWIGLAPSDVPLALRDLSTEEVVAWKLAR